MNRNLMFKTCSVEKCLLHESYHYHWTFDYSQHVSKMDTATENRKIWFGQNNTSGVVARILFVCFLSNVCLMPFGYHGIIM